MSSWWSLLKWLWPSTIRTRMICGVAFIHLVLMSAFVVGLVEQQRAFLRQQSIEHTHSLVQTLAINSSSWVLANDVAGLEEIVVAVRLYPGLRYAMVVSNDGQVLAHTDRSRVGLYLNDDTSRALLQAQPEVRILHAGPALLDVAAPILTSTGKLAGWARIGQGREHISKNLAAVTRNGILYTLLALAVGSAFAILIGYRLTSGLNRLLALAGQVKDGRHDLRMAITHDDEISRLGEGFNRMLDAIVAGEENIQKASDEILDLYNNAPCGYHSLDKDGLFIRINDTELRWLGYQREELIGKRRFTDLVAESSLKTFRDNFPLFKERGWVHDLEFEMVRKDGSILPVLLSATAVFDDNGHYAKSRSTIYDITERKQAEREREQYFTFFQSSADLMVIADPNGCFKKINPACLESLGYSEAEILVKPFIEFVHPDDRQATLDEMARQLQRGFSLNFENRYLCKDGTVRWFSWRARYNEAEGLTYGTARDITERKHDEEQIRLLKNSLANIVDSMPSVLVAMDRNEIVTQWNRRAEEATGITAAEALGQPISRLLPDFSPWVEAMHSKSGKRRPASLEKLLLEKGGERHFYDLMMYPLTTNGVEGTVVRIEDVTERTRIQELMIQTEKMMSVGGLAAGMAHEINNPLGIITQAIQNIERRVSPDLPANQRVARELGISMEELHAYFGQRQIPQFIDSIRVASARASRIVTNMLRFSRRAETTMEPVSLGALLEQALELAANDYDLKKKYDFRSIEIVREYAPDIPEVPVVAVEIEQVVLNMLKNAAQAMTANPPGRNPRIVLRLGQDGKYAVIEVEDNGPGMTEDIRRRVFEPFFSTKSPDSGTGLGLSVSFMIVTRNHKGLMEVVSTPGNGTCFTVRLPLHTEGSHE